VKTITETLCSIAAQSPSRRAIVCGVDAWTYGELWARVTSIAGELAAAGVRCGDRVLLAAPSLPEYIAAYYAVHEAGGIAVPFDPALPGARLLQLAERTRPALAIAEDLAAAPGCPVLRLAQLGASDAAYRDPGHRDRDDVADLMFTTGTTGQPKGVCLTHGNLASAVRQINAVIGTESDDIEIVPLPLYHSFGLGRVRCCLSVGATVVLVKGFSLPGEILAAFERHAATAMAAVPAGLAVLLRFGERGLGAIAHQLRYIEIGSAPMSGEHKQQLKSLLPDTALFMHYGLTEASRSAFIELHRDAEHLATVGRATPGVAIEARDEDGHRQACGQPGVLWIRGPHVARGYWDAPELSAAAFVDGWLRTGDLGSVDERGYITLHGRQDDIVNVGGFKVFPEEVERVLARHPSVAEVACVGAPDPRGVAGSVLRAYLVAAQSGACVEDTELRDLASGELEPYKIPDSFQWVASLPKTDSGKLRRAAIREEVAHRPDEDMAVVSEIEYE
jgi:long-chain acyl-CoA synthetase